VALSISEAEYVALSSATQEVVRMAKEVTDYLPQSSFTATNHFDGRQPRDYCNS